MMPKHLRTDDIDAWTATHGRPLQIGQWVNVIEHNEPPTEWDGAFMVTGLELDVETGELSITLSNGQASESGFNIEDLKEARHG